MDDDLPEPRNRKKRKSQRIAGDVRPFGVLLAAASIGVLLLLNLWTLLSGDELVWKLIAVLRLFVEIRVLWGLKERQDQTALTATVAAGMMAVISIYLLYIACFDADVRLESTVQELRNARIFFSLQTLAEFGVLLGLNLPASKRYLSVR
jgi:hypothetical protein